MKHSPLYFFLFIALTAVSSLQAQERGRLANGQAYRTDQSGTQIVDYIAELEVENDALERRANTLEDEVMQLRKQLKTKALSRPLEERAIGGRVPVSEQMVQPPVAKAPESCTCTELLCDTFISEVEARNRVKMSEQEILQKQCTDELEMYRTKFSAQTAEQQALREQTGSLSAEKSDLNTQVASLQQTVSSSNAEIARLTRVEGSLKANEAVLMKENANLKKQVAALEQQKSQQAVQQVALKPLPDVRENSQTRGSMRVPPKAPSLIPDQRRSIVVKRIKTVIALEKKRDSLYRSYRSTAIKVQKSSLLTKRGRTPAALLTVASGTNDPRRFRDAEKESLRLEKMVESDIALIKRLKSSR